MWTGFNWLRIWPIAVTVVNTVMNFRVPEKDRDVLLINCQLLYEGIWVVSHWLPTVARVISFEISSCKHGTGAGFLLVILFPLPIFIPPTAPNSLVILSQAP
jgi:hypothetical protein